MKPVLKYPGAKWTLAQWIIDHMPPHTTYLEPFFGSGAVFFNKPPSKVETINDIDGNVVNLFRVIRSQPEELAALIEMTPWAREEYYASYEKTGDELEDARRFLVRCWQAFGTKLSGGRTGWRHDKHIYVANKIDTWNQIPERIKVTTQRLKMAQIENIDAVELIKKHNKKEVLIYADPPYVLETRAGELYAHEMDNDDQIKLLDTLDNHPGPVLLSGYEHELYNKRLKHWHKEKKTTQAEKGLSRVEVLWLNPVATAYMKTGVLF